MCPLDTFLVFVAPALAGQLRHASFRPSGRGATSTSPKFDLFSNKLHILHTNCKVWSLFNK